MPEDANLKQILTSLVDEAEFLRAHSLYLSTLLSRQGIRASRDEVQDGMMLAKQENLKKFDSLRKQIEALP